MKQRIFSCFEFECKKTATALEFEGAGREWQSQDLIRHADYLQNYEVI